LLLLFYRAAHFVDQQAEASDEVQDNDGSNNIQSGISFHTAFYFHPNLRAISYTHHDFGHIMKKDGEQKSLHLTWIFPFFRLLNNLPNPNTMKTILFPTDFSSCADHAFGYALRMANKFQARIVTLHVYQLPDIRGVNLPHTLQEVYQSIDLEEFEDYKDSVPRLRQIAQEEGLEHLEIQHVMREGQTVSTIIQVAQEIEADMIIMGTKGASGLKELFFGSITGEVLENAFTPVLSIPKEARFDGAIDKIAITTAFAEEETKAIWKVLHLARLFAAKVYCVNVDTSHIHFYTQRMEQLRATFADEPDIEFRVLEGNYIYEPLSEFMEKEEIDILAMLTHKRNFFQELFNFSTTKQMAYHATTPILSIQAHTLEAEV
jgi:nucleotide-binding universal stress UspA family protein